MKRAIAVSVLLLLGSTGGFVASATADEVAAAAVSDDLAGVTEEAVERETRFDSWALGLSLGFDVLMQDASGEIETNFAFRDRFQRDLGVRASGSEFFINPMFGFNAELTSPALFDVAGYPRVYLGAGVRYAQKLRHIVASSGNRPLPLPEEEDYFAFPTFKNSIREPRLPTYIDGKVNPECEGSCSPERVTGQGLSLQAEFGHLYWQTEIGLVFTIPFDERSLLIKPAVGYFQQQMEIEGLAHRVYRDATTKEYTNLELDVAATETFRAIGPKIMFELEAVRFSQVGQRFGASVFFDAGAYWTVGNRSLSASREQDVPGDFPPGRNDGVHENPQRVQYDFQLDTMSYRLGVGFKLNWYPL